MHGHPVRDVRAVLHGGGEFVPEKMGVVPDKKTATPSGGRSLKALLMTMCNAGKRFALQTLS